MIVPDVILRAARWMPCALLAVLAGTAGLGLVRETMRERPLPPMPVVAEAPPPVPLMVVARPALAGPIETAHYAIIAVKNLFSASRGEQVEAAAAGSGPRPFLHGVVLDGPRSRAYLEDPGAQRVSGYGLGDAVGGGKLVRILEDRVVIRRRDGLMEIMLKDPAKPQSAPAVGPDAPGAPAPGPLPAPGLATESPAATVPAPQGPK